MIDRRHLLGSLAAVAVPSLAMAQDWGYDGPAGPDRWGLIRPDWQACMAGQEQSPVDLIDAVRADLPMLALSSQPVEGRAVYSGGLVVETGAGCRFTLAGDRFELQFYRFHHPSEHAIGGQRANMEMQFWFRQASTGRWCALATMIVEGAAHAALGSVLDLRPAMGSPVAAPMLDPTSLMPRNRQAYWRYQGSMTTPPCAEVVLWTVLREPVQASREQIVRFTEAYPANARPLVPMGRRFLLSSGA